MLSAVVPLHACIHAPALVAPRDLTGAYNQTLFPAAHEADIVASLSGSCIK